MSHDERPVLSIIVRRFALEYKDDILHSLDQLQQAAADQKGYLGDHNSLSRESDGYQLVNIFAFSSRENLDSWEDSEVRKSCLAELDRHPQEATEPARFDDIAQLLQPASKISKIEIVVILIFWIVVLGAVLGHLAEFILPESFLRTGRSVLLISVNVVLISYIFLPWSSHWVTKLKARLAGSTENK
ncbi:hypothetical protein J7376_19365 [Paracoccus sp. R12_1]|uniref:hypothetical protein n=1 Tax=unclassified Paracoccus (in: a-proteobacteria) TaxID=2688777 RepID=UPI001AD9EB8C|nr:MULTISPECIES: hypothetical protein [unclassified Paracoccus (in: a-proteobacteria)]MBO9457392.1 hypothetical protein [Paracoccus sp. R12_2]MBO9488669.1 hypothetical protein [Paracoccus sp. R12_1]